MTCVVAGAGTAGYSREGRPSPCAPGSHSGPANGTGPGGAAQGRGVAQHGQGLGSTPSTMSAQQSPRHLPFQFLRGHRHQEGPTLLPGTGPVCLGRRGCTEPRPGSSAFHERATPAPFPGTQSVGDACAPVPRVVAERGWGESRGAGSRVPLSQRLFLRGPDPEAAGHRPAGAAPGRDLSGAAACAPLTPSPGPGHQLLSCSAVTTKLSNFTEISSTRVSILALGLGDHQCQLQETPVATETLSSHRPTGEGKLVLKLIETKPGLHSSFSGNHPGLRQSAFPPRGSRLIRPAHLSISARFTFGVQARYSEPLSGRLMWYQLFMGKLGPHSLQDRASVWLDLRL